MTTALIAILAIVLFPIAFAAMWSGVLCINSLIGGWWGLSSRYRAEGERPASAELTSGMARFFMSYSFVLYVAGTPEGLHLSVMGIFRPGHPPVLIPWDEVRRVGPGFSLMGPWVKLDLDGAPFSMPEEVWQRAVAARRGG